MVKYYSFFFFLSLSLFLFCPLMLSLLHINASLNVHLVQNEALDPHMAYEDYDMDE